MQQFIYLHGFASSPQSFKAQYLAKSFHAHGHNLVVPDLNLNDFQSLTLTRQINQTKVLIDKSTTPVTIIGSSFGGLAAAWVAERCTTVNQLILLAPAFQFTQHWFPKIGVQALQNWHETGEMNVYHYGQKSVSALSYNFVRDIERYNERQLKRSIPTLIIHGLHDEVIPVRSSQQFSATRPWVELHEINSNHELGDVIEKIWLSICEFCQIDINDQQLT